MWEQPVIEPWTTGVHCYEYSRAHYREDGHRFCRTVDRHTPFLTEQEKYGRDERSGVTDTDPPNEVGNIPGPAYGSVSTPLTDTSTDCVSKTAETPEECERSNGKYKIPVLVR